MGNRKLGIALLLAAACPAQPLSLADAVQRAAQTYPSVTAALEQVGAAAAGVQLARTAYLPKADAVAQVNRATHNNVFGMLLPQSVIAPISGPALTTNAGGSVWGSATGFLVNWEPFDFGLREARTNAARATEAHASATAARTAFEAGTAAAEAFLTTLAAGQSVKGARAALDRARALETSVAALSKAGLRPEADLERSRAESAAAEAYLIQTEQAVRIARATLAQFTGADVKALDLLPGRLLSAPETPAEAPAAHPALREQTAAIAEAAARRKTLDRTFYPKFNLQSTAYARGTGANLNGSGQGGANGLGPNFYNWGLGLTVLFPFLDAPAIHAQQRAEASRVRAEERRLARVQLELSAQREKALALVDTAQRLAATLPRQLAAARAAHAQAGARYKAGLAAITEVADAQRLLLQAELDQSLANLAIWRAQLALAAAEGDLKPLAERAGR